MPYDPEDKEHGPYSKTHKANTPKRRRQWEHVFESERARGKSEGKAIQMASGVVKKQVAHDKAAMDKTALPALGAIGKGLMSAVKSPGVGGRMAIGAGLGAVGGYATKPKDSTGVGRALAGAGLGAIGGAMTSGNFRSSAARALSGKPAGRVFATGPVAPISIPGAAKTAAPVGMLGKVLSSAPMGRVLGGAALGAGLGYATKPEGSTGTGRALAGGALGALGGAASSKAFRGNVMRSTGFSTTVGGKQHIMTSGATRTSAGGVARGVHDPKAIFQGMSKARPVAAAPAAPAAPAPSMGRTIGRGLGHVSNAPEAAIQKGIETRREIGAGFREVSKPGVGARISRLFGGGKAAPAAAAPAAAAGTPIGGGINRAPGVAAAESYLSKNRSFGDRLRGMVGGGPKPAPMTALQPRSMPARPGARVAREPGTGMGTNLGAGKRRDIYLAPHQRQSAPTGAPGAGTPAMASAKLHAASKAREAGQIGARFSSG